VLNFFADTTGRPDVDRDFPHERCRQLVRAAAGDPDLDVEILTVNPWAMSARIADTYRLGPVLFAGDAAHLFPPTGGLGMNTAVQDVHNLTWKIAHVLTGRAGPGLLDTYDPERRLVGRRNMEQSVVNAMRMAASGAAFDPDKLEALDDPVRGADLRQEVAAAIELQRDEFQTLGQTLGFTYDSDAVVSDGTEPDAPADVIREYRPSGRPGARAPHVWIRSGEGRVSTLDLFDKDHVLLVPTPTSPWVTSAAALGIRHVVVTEAGDEPPEQSWLDTYGITPTGAVLVRPDGHIGWRAHDDMCDAALTSAHEQLTFSATGHSGHHN
jgi:hypothetical protein